MEKLSKEEITLIFLKDSKKLKDEILYGNVPKSDEIRTLICDLGDHQCAYYYAYCVDKSPHPYTRQAACKDPGWAYSYARYIDKSPRSDTRQAVQKDPKWKERYEK